MSSPLVPLTLGRHTKTVTPMTNIRMSPPSTMRGTKKELDELERTGEKRGSGAGEWPTLGGPRRRSYEKAEKTLESKERGIGSYMSNAIDQISARSQPLNLPGKELL